MLVLEAGECGCWKNVALFRIFSSILDGLFISFLLQHLLFSSNAFVSAELRKNSLGMSKEEEEATYPEHSPYKTLVLWFGRMKCLG